MQKRIFGISMAVLMVLGMELYNAVLQHGASLATLAALPWAKGAVIVVLVLLVEHFLGAPLGALIRRKIGEGGWQQRLSTVVVMCPAMSMVAMFMFKGGLQPGFVQLWLKTVAFNLPMAFCWSALVAVPLTKILVGRISRSTELLACQYGSERQHSASTAPTSRP